MVERTLSDHVATLSAAVPAVVPELQQALDKATADPKESLSKSRLAFEKLIKELAAFEEAEPKSKNPGDILKDKRVRAVIPVSIHAEMQFVYSVASEYGSHVGVPPAGLAVNSRCNSNQNHNYRELLRFALQWREPFGGNRTMLAH